MRIKNKREKRKKGKKNQRWQSIDIIRVDGHHTRARYNCYVRPCDEHCACCCCNLFCRVLCPALPLSSSPAHT